MHTVKDLSDSNAYVQTMQKAKIRQNMMEINLIKLY